jgi:hypothetical protein
LDSIIARTNAETEAPVADVPVRQPKFYLAEVAPFAPVETADLAEMHDTNQFFRGLRNGCILNIGLIAVIAACTTALAG